MTHTRIIGMNSEEIMVSNDFNGEAWHILDQLLAHKKRYIWTLLIKQ